MYDNREEIKTIPLVWQNLLRQFSLDLEMTLPATVISYDRAKNLVTCRPAINRITVENKSVERSEVVVPCVNFTGNDIGINFPLKAGDTGWIIAADRDTENFKKTRKVADPHTYELHRYDFGMFIPDQVSGFKVSNDDKNALVIQTLNGKTKIAIDHQKITIESQKDLVINADSATINIEKDANITVGTSATLICPETTITGNIAVTGEITATGDITAGNISLMSHAHLDPTEEYTITGKPAQ